MSAKKIEEPKPIYYTPSAEEEVVIQKLIADPEEPIIVKRTDALKWLVYHGMKSEKVVSSHES